MTSGNNWDEAAYERIGRLMVSFARLNESPISTGEENSPSGLTLGVTAVHPIWSETRQDFIAAGNLRPQEEAIAIDGQTWRLTSITSRAGPESVYNFEVANEHVYFVTRDGLLVHNAGNGIYLTKHADGAINAVPQAGKKAASEVAGYLTGPSRLADHHIFPQQFRNFFSRRGIDIDDFTITVEHKITHLRGIHGRGNLGQFPGRWNWRWRDFINANPHATARDIYHFAGRLLDDFNLGHLRIHPYGG